jgi:Tfp pilus assembly protein PilO
MTITFYNNKSENSRIDKTSYLEEVLSIEGTLRDSCSVTNPVIQVQHVDFLNANYAYIPEFNRYYFITDIVSVRTYLWEIHMHVDVLMSFGEQLRQLTAYVSRWEKSTYENIIDDKRKYYSIPSITMLKLKSVPWADYDAMKFASANRNYPWYVVVMDTENGYVTGRDPTGYYKEFINYSRPREDLMTCYGSDLFDPNYVRIYICTNTNFLGWLAESTIRGSHVINAYAIPNPNAYKNGAVNPSFIRMCGGSSGNNFSDIKVTNIQVGKEEYTPVELVFEVQNRSAIRSVYFDSFEVTPKISEKYYYGYPFTTKKLYIPMYGVVDIPSAENFNSPIALNTILDLTTGIYSCSLTYHKPQGSVVIDVFDAFECPKIPLTYNGSEEYIRQKSYNNMVMSIKALNFSKGLMNDLISIGSGVAQSAMSESPTSGMSSITSGISGIANSGFDIASLFIQNDMLNLMTVQTGKPISISSSYSTYQLSPYTTTLITVTYNASEPNTPNFAKFYGIPYYRTSKLDIKGFFIVENIHLENINCLDEERIEIKKMLGSGVIG